MDSIDNAGAFGMPLDDRPMWEIRGYKVLSELESKEEWEQYVAEADEDLNDGRLLSKWLTWQEIDMPLPSVARVAALRRRLIRELKAATLVETMLIDLMVANYQQQCQWFELLGSRTYVLQQRKPRHRGEYRSDAVEGTYLEEMSDRIVPVLDRLNRQFLGTVKALRDLKTSPIVVNIGKAGQVNVGEQQVNIDAANSTASSISPALDSQPADEKC